MIKLGSLAEFSNKPVSEIVVNELNLLLINNKGNFYLIENKCGHFGVPLSDGKISDTEITCSQHGISFSLLNGAVVNRKYENCDKIRVFKIIKQHNDLFFLNSQDV